MKRNSLILFALIQLIFISCEDKVVIDVPDGETKMVIQGTLKSTDSIQHIFITTTNEYFSNQRTPTVSGASVIVNASDGNSYTFTEDADTLGRYDAYIPLDSNVEYVLNVVAFGEIYQSYPEKLLRVPEIDSL